MFTTAGSSNTARKKVKATRTTGQSSLQVKNNSGGLQGGDGGQGALSPTQNNFSTQ